MSRLVRKHLGILRALSRVKDAKTRRTILRNAPGGVINALSEIALNAVRGRLKLTSQQHRRLYKHRKVLRALAKRGSAILARRRLLVQRGGFIQFLLPAALSFLSGLIGKAIVK